MGQLLDILMHFFNYPEKSFYGRQIASQFGIPDTTAYKKLDLLYRNGFLLKHNKNYALNPILVRQLRRSLRKINEKKSTIKEIKNGINQYA